MHERQILTSDDLARELDRLDVAFLMSGLPPIDGESVDPARLLASLASSRGARMRLALIPLLLRRPEVAGHAPTAATHLTGDDRTILRCYYTAAVILQRKYADRLRALGLPTEELPDWFSAGLDVPVEGDVDERLAALGRKQAALSGEDINWVGTYDHAATTFLSLRERSEEWNKASTESAYGSS